MLCNFVTALLASRALALVLIPANAGDTPVTRVQKLACYLAVAVHCACGLRASSIKDVVALSPIIAVVVCYHRLANNSSVALFV